MTETKALYLKVALKGEQVDRFLRLKKKLGLASNGELVRLAVWSLEERTREESGQDGL